MTGSSASTGPFARASVLVVALAAAAGIAFVLLPRGDANRGPDAPGPIVASDAPRGDGVDLRGELRRAVALGPAAEERAKSLARDVLARVDPNDEQAHTVLGHREFARALPEGISLVRLDFMRTLDRARKQRWFEDAESYETAEKALAEADAYARRLRTDRVHRALDAALREVEAGDEIGRRAYEAVFAPPYLVLGTRPESEDPVAAAFLPSADRKVRMASLAANAALRHRELAERATILQQGYADFLRRYGEECRLVDLMSDYGGRPDHPPEHRRFPDGCPLVVTLVRGDEEAAFLARREQIGGLGGCIDAETGRACLLLPGTDYREVLLGWTLGVGSRQLLHWFRRQRRADWRPADPPLDFFEMGFVDCTEATMGRDRVLRFEAEPLVLIKGWHDVEPAMKQRGEPFMPLERLLSLRGTAAIGEYGEQRAETVGLTFVRFRYQAVMFLASLRARSPTDFVKVLDSALSDGGEGEPRAADRVQRLYGLETHADRMKFQEDFRLYVHRTKGMDRPTPPDLSDWPGYVAPEVYGLGAR